MSASKPGSFTIPVSAPKPIGTLVNRKDAQSVVILGSPVIQDAGKGVADLVSQVIATWAYVENEWAAVLAAILNSEWSVVAEMWLALKSTVAQEAMLQAGVSHRLRGEDLQLFAAIRKAIGPIQKRRNQYAHHLWGYCPQHPQRLCLVDPTLPFRKLASVTESLHEVRDLLPSVESDPSMKAIRGAWSVAARIDGEDLLKVPSYSRSDVAIDRLAAHKAVSLVRAFSILVTGPIEATNTARRWLSSEMLLVK